ncbi:archaeal fructose-1,6-bisphosphatase and related enzymes of inositol monophosphatase family [Coriobacteriaceae bacterium EMTCatB1]|nr:archaeal fructose-1,6-bisphosphatase and related enzymes of inositol monophosphatase family [Coriobacteriaceae bacterium EMTCatB1]
MEALLDVAAAAARAGGTVLRSMRSEFGSARTKSSRVDFVTDADVAAGVAACRAIAERMQGALFVVEEPEVYELAGVARGELGADDVWVIDPLDGTTSFVHGYPCYSTSVAFVSGDQPVAGAVYNAALDELAVAQTGRGARLDGAPLTVSGVERIEDALLVTGIPYDRGRPFEIQMRAIERIARVAHDIRRDGSAAVDCCHVAAGRVDGFWEFGLKPWDLAAGVVILREAGAVVTGADGRDWDVFAPGIVTAGPALHAHLLQAVLEAQR